MAYYTYSEGVRVGGRNGGVAQRPAAAALGAPLTFEPDKLINNEIGFKTKSVDGRALANMNFFMMDWEDYQIHLALDIAGATTVNAGNASIDGFEGQFAFRPTENWELSAAFTFLDARIDDDIVLNNGTIVAGKAGDVLPAVPEWKTQLSVAYATELPWAGLEGSARFDFSYVGESVNATNASVLLFGASSSLPKVQPSYELGNLRFSVTTQDEMEFWLGINNLWDERAITYIWPRFADDRVFTVRPREVRVGFYKPF